MRIIASLRKSLPCVFDGQKVQVCFGDVLTTNAQSLGQYLTRILRKY